MVRITCFGQIAATVRGQPARLSPQALLLVAILEVDKGRSSSRSRLIDLLWSSNPTPERRHSLSQLIYEIRRHLGSEALTSIRGGISVHNTESDYHDILRSRSWDEIEQLIGKGDFLLGASLDRETFSDWRAARLAHIRRYALAMGHQALEQARSRFDWARVARVSDVMLRCDAYDEGAWLGRIQALAADGAVSRAQGEIASVRLLFRNDLGQPLPVSIQLAADQLLNVQDSVPHSDNTYTELPFVSREKELTAIGNACRRSRVERSVNLVIIAGPAGIGKTRLLDRAIRAELMAGSTCIMLHCEERTRLDAFNGVRQLIRNAKTSELSALSAEWKDFAMELAKGKVAARSGAARHVGSSAVNEVFCQVIRARSASQRGLIIAVDDLQWMDRASLGALEYAIRKVVSKGVTWIVASRLEGLPIANGIASGWRQIHEGVPCEIDIGPLSEESVVALVDRITRDEPDWSARWASEALAYSGGNPLLLSLWITHKQQAELRTCDLGGLDLNSIDENNRVVAQALTILGGRAGLGVLREVAGIAEPSFEDALSDLRKVGWIRTTSSTAEFTHDLVREKIAQGLTETDSERTHFRALAVLRRSKRQSTSILARHALASGDGDSASIYALEAAGECVSLGAHEEAEFFLREAVERAPTLALRQEALLSLGRHYVSVDKVREAKQCFDQVPSIQAQPADDLNLYRRYVDLRAELLALSRNATAVVSEALDLLTDLSQHGHKELLAQAVCIAIEAAHDSGQSHVIERAMTDLESLWLSCSDQDRAFVAGLLSRACGLYGELRHAMRWTNRAADAAVQSQDDLAILRALLAKATGSMVSGHVSAAIAYFEEALERSRSPRSFYYQQRILNNYGVALIEANRLEHAREVFREALAAASGHDRLFLIGNLAHTELILGCPKTALLHARALEGLNSTFGATWVVMFCNAIRASAEGSSFTVSSGMLTDMLNSHVYGMHELVVQHLIEGLHEVDCAAGRAATSAFVRAMRGRDFLLRARIRVLELKFSERTPSSSRRLQRLSLWASRRGAKRLATEISSVLHAAV